MTCPYELPYRYTHYDGANDAVVKPFDYTRKRGGGGGAFSDKRAIDGELESQILAAVAAGRRTR